MLWLAGDGDLRPTLESMCRDLGIAAHVRFLGRLGNETIWKYYAAADLFVLPSEVESWGTVMLESMACGTRVVTTDTVGGLEVRENFPDEVDRRAASGLGHDWRRRCRNSQLLRRVLAGDAGSRVNSDFTVAACASQYLPCTSRSTEPAAMTGHWVIAQLIGLAHGLAAAASSFCRFSMWQACF